MKRVVYWILAMVLAVFPLQVQPESPRPQCAGNGLDCLRSAVARVENDSSGVINLSGLRLAYVGALARSEAFSEAEMVAALLARPRDRVLAFVAIAEEQAKVGLTTQARESIAAAKRNVATVEHIGLQMELVAAIAGAELIAGDLELATSTIKPVLAFLETQEAGWSKNHLIDGVIQSGLMFQDVSSVRALIATIDSPYDRNDSIIRFAGVLAQGDNFSTALQEVMQIEQIELRVEALSAYSILLTSYGEAELAAEAAENARQIVEGARTNTSRAFAFIRVAKAFAVLGDKRAASEMSVRGLVQSRLGLDRTSYSGFLIELANVAMLLGEPSSAIDALEAVLHTVEGIEDGNMRALPLADVAAAFLKNGDASRAFEIFESVSDKDTQSLILFVIAGKI